MTLWCLHIPGPDDVFAAPDRATADRWAEQHNASLDRAFWGWGWPTREAMTGVVIEYPWSAERHAEGVRTNVFSMNPKGTPNE